MNSDHNQLIVNIRRRISNIESRTDFSNVVAVEVYPPVSESAVVSFENKIGLKMPKLLRRLYCEVGNGGYGPGYGLIGVGDGHRDGEGRSLSELYTYMESQYFCRGEGCPIGVLPICEWGAGIWSCVDCLSEDGSIITLHNDGLTLTSHNLYSWLHAWINHEALWCEMFEFESIEILNPFTGRPTVSKKRKEAIGRTIFKWG